MADTRPMLTELQLKALKAAPSEYKILDSPGLYVRVRPGGTKTFLSRYTAPDGREGLLSQGVWPDVPLKRAREKHAELAAAWPMAWTRAPCAKRPASRAWIPSHHSPASG